MALKTFNLNEETYRRFSEYCKNEGLSMSKKIDNFIKREMDRVGVEESSEKKIEKRDDNSHPMDKYC